MKVIINVYRGMVESVYSEMESLEVIVNDKDSMGEEDMEPITEEMTCLYEF